MFSPLYDGSYLRSLAHQVELQFCKFLAYLEHYTIFSRFFQKSDQTKEAGTKVLASQLSLDCRARRSGWVGSTTLVSSAFTALLNFAEVGRRNPILTNYRFLSHSHFI